MFLFGKFLHVWFDADGGGGMGGGDAGGAGETGGDAGVTELAAEAQGREGEDTQQHQTAPDEKTRKAEYKRMLAQYKDLDDARMQKTVQARLKGAKDAEERYGKLAPAIDLLQKKYGALDLDELTQKITNDNAYYENEAQARGMDVDAYKALVQGQRAIEQLNQQREAQQKALEQQRKVMSWRQQETELQQAYPDFSLDAEMEDEESGRQLFSMLDAGVSLEAAYKALHFDDLVPRAIGQAVVRTQQRTMDTIRANGMRPSENGMGGRAGAQVKFDVSKMTRAQCEALERRAARGEKITPEMFGV